MWPPGEQRDHAAAPAPVPCISGAHGIDDDLCAGADDAGDHRGDEGGIVGGGEPDQREAR